MWHLFFYLSIQVFPRLKQCINFGIPLSNPIIRKMHKKALDDEGYRLTVGFIISLIDQTIGYLVGIKTTR
ncbi:Uncharacterised protein [Yersinia intermedia]|jgi:hypothetical protein|nr:hypothetical protein CH53_4395 [Yersinia intermedia]CND59811.1 Uncharacterised protein [Yersinia intermedia]CNH16185.1 Uncharacterised protein [Yersinia intermedia]CNH95005.1 Uncharacterised protein [Yersinia intermedia]CNJ52267.1 Uncharacterised protein [Yersinia intermedia]